jgi:putative flippase GtrA
MIFLIDTSFTTLKEIFLQFLKFGVVGFTGLFVDFGITWFLKEKVGWHKYLANSLGFIAAASSNYLLNRIWTFESQDPEILSQYSKFLIISIIGLGLNNFFIYIFNDRLNFNFYFAKLLAIGLVTFWNFFANYFFTF